MTVVDAPAERVDGADLSALLAQASAGDRDAFTRFYDLTSPRIYALLLATNPDTGRARELLEAIYVEAWERLRGRSAPPCPGLEWMSSLAHRHAARR